MANPFMPDNSQPCGPSLGSTGECGNNGGGPVRAPINNPNEVANCGTCGSPPGTGTGNGGGGSCGNSPGGSDPGSPGPGGAPWPPRQARGGPPSGFQPMSGPLGPVGVGVLGGSGNSGSGGGGGSCGCNTGGGAPPGGGITPGGGGPPWQARGGAPPSGFMPMNGPIGPIGGTPIIGVGGLDGNGNGSTSGGSCGCGNGGDGNAGDPGGTGTGDGNWPPPIAWGPGLAMTPGFVMNNFGGGDDALHRAAAMPAIARSRALPAIRLSTGGCNSLGGHCVVNPANGNLLLQIAPPVGDAFYLTPVLSYNSTNASTSSEVGNGWSHTFKREVMAVPPAPPPGRLPPPGASGNPTVLTGAGQTFTYDSNASGGYLTPAPGSGAINSLYALANYTGFTETAPDGTAYVYGAAIASPLTPAPLLSITNPAGATWSLTYDSSNRVSSVSDPFSRRTTFTYNATSGKISSILDSYGRYTTFTVNSSGNLVQITSPELCITSLVYDGSNRPIAWINPLGDRTSYSFGSMNRITTATTPLGQVTSLTYNTNQTLVTNPRGYVTTLNFTSNGSLGSAIDGTGDLTSYAWDATNRLTAITDGLGNTTTFAYVTNATTLVENLASVTQPLGGVFSLTYSGNQVSSVTDQLGNTTSLVWNATGYRTAAVDAQSNRTSYSYNSNGLLTAIQNPLGETVSFVFNSVGQKTAPSTRSARRRPSPTTPTVWCRRSRTRSAPSRPICGTRSTESPTPSIRWETPSATSTTPIAASPRSPIRSAQPGAWPTTKMAG